MDGAVDRIRRLNATTVYDVAARLPDIPIVRARCQAMAMLDAILIPEAGHRIYSFEVGRRPGQDLASMNNGSGDTYSIAFSAAGVLVCGFAHESPMSPYHSGETWPGILDMVPGAFTAYCSETKLMHDGVTVCLWREAGDDRWRCGEVSFPAARNGGRDWPCGPLLDGAGWLFEVLLAGPEAYQELAQDDDELLVPLNIVQHVYALRPLTNDMVVSLNPNRTLADLGGDAAQIGYPTRRH